MADMKNTVSDENPRIEKIVEFLTQGSEQRFWEELESQMQAGRNRIIKKVLQAVSTFHINRETYPKNFGHLLFHIIQSLSTEMLKNFHFPLLSMSEFVRLIQFVEESGYDDIRLLLKAIYGEKLNQPVGLCEEKESIDELPANSYEEKVENILSEVSEDALTKRIGIPIDSARACYVINSILVTSFESFNKKIVSFYLHLLRNTWSISDSVSLEAAGPEAFALLERAFTNKGGIKAALAEAKHATKNGGLRFVFDQMTNQFKREEQGKHVNSVLKSVMDPLDWEGKVALTGEIIKRLEHNLPSKITSQPPERWAGHYEIIVRAYVESMDQVKSLFRSF